MMTDDLKHVRLQVGAEQRRVIDNAVRDFKLGLFMAVLLGVGVGYSIPGHAYSNHDAMQASESRSYACREYAEGVRTVAESRDQGGSLAAWLNVAEAQAWADLVVSVWDTDASPSDLFALHYAECVRGGSWEVTL